MTFASNAVRALRTPKVADDRPVIDYIENTPAPN
jgi:hypothetical protein